MAIEALSENGSPMSLKKTPLTCSDARDMLALCKWAHSPELGDVNETDDQYCKGCGTIRRQGWRRALSLQHGLR
jgi:hypothetical protein